MASNEGQARPSRRQTYIQIKMDSMIQQYRQQRQRRWWLPACPDCASSSGVHESITRCVNFARFSLVCCAGAFNAMAPWMLAAIEALTVLLIYMFAVPDALIVHVPLEDYSYSLETSCEDVVVLSFLRFAVVMVAYLFGAGPQYQRPYLYAAMFTGVLSLPFVLLKSALLRRSGMRRTQWPSHLALFATHGGFSIAHMLAAQRVVTWARKRYEMGLLGFGYPWEEGEQTWLLAGQLPGAGLGRAVAEGGGNSAAAGGGRRGTLGPGVIEMHDVPAEQLADDDSRFLEDCQGLRVHYKLALPQDAYEPGDTAILLIHGFGGGTFSWRHIMQPLADSCGMAVVAFDRPGFGLTSRPEVPPKAPLEDNPYSLKFQAVLTLKLAWQLGLARVLLVGHEDGALVALMAAAMSCREGEHFSFSPSPPRPATPPIPASPFSPLAPLSAAVPITPPIPLSMDAAWEGSLAASGLNNHHKSFLQRLLHGEFSPSPTNTLLAGGGLAAGYPWPQRAKQQRRDQWGVSFRQPLLSLSRYSLDLADGWHEDEQGRTWWAQPRQHAVHDGDGCPILPCSTDTSPPHSVASHTSQQHCVVALHEPLLPAWAGPDEGRPAAAEQQQQQQHAAWHSRQQQQQREAAPAWHLGPSSLGAGRGPQQAAAAAMLAAPQQQRMPGHGPQPASTAGGCDLVGPGCSCAEGCLSHGPVAAGEAAAEVAAGAVPAVHAVPVADPAQDLAVSTPEGAEAACSRPHCPPTHSPPSQHPSQQQQQQQEHSRHQQGQCWEHALHEAQHDAEAACWHLPGWHLPLAVGLVLLHPDLSGQVAPRYARVLGNSRLGRRMLRHLLRTEVGEVSNRRAWSDDSHLTPEVLELYKRPLQVEDWDRALIEVCRTPNIVHSPERAHLLRLVASCGLPTLVMTGERDHMSTPAAAALLSERLPGSRLAVLPGCGHLSHEERPDTLLDFLEAFIQDVAAQTQAGGSLVGAGGGA